MLNADATAPLYSHGFGLHTDELEEGLEGVGRHIKSQSGSKSERDPVPAHGASVLRSIGSSAIHQF